MNNKNSDYYFLKGGGEMGELIRAKDWSKTSLGDPATWPQSLRTMVAVMLDNPFGMYIAWGTEYTQIYNDGYRPILGATKHPQALGISTKETFSEIWDNIIGCMFDDVMKGKAVGFPDLMLPLNRNGFIEECYFDFAYSPIRKDDGEVGGVLVTVIETTEKKRATEALKESNARFINNIMQAPVAMCIFRGENYVVEIANEQCLNLWGKHADQVMNKPIFEGLPEAKDQGLEALLHHVYHTGEKFVANERPVDLPRNGKVETTYVNFVYEALKEPDGTISGVAGIAIEVTPQVIARSKVEESEQKVRALVENAPFPIAVYVGKEMIVELTNQSIIDIWGKGNDVIGKSFKEVLPELDNQLVFEQIKKVLETGESFHTKNTPLDLIIDGKPYTYYFNYSFTPLYDISGNIYGVMNTGVDLTELNIAKKKIEESDKRFRNTMKQAPVGITILRGAQYIVEMANDAYLQLVDKKESEFVGNSLFTTLPEVKEVVHPLLDSVLKTGIPYHGNEVPIPLKRYGKQDVFYFDFLYYPLKEEDEKISGVIVIVTEVTEKVGTRKKIEESESNLKLMIHQAPVSIGILRGLDYTVEIVNKHALELWGRTEQQVLGKPIFTSMPELLSQGIKELLDGVRTTGKRFATAEMPVQLLRNGVMEKVYVNFSYEPLYDADEKINGIMAVGMDVTHQVVARKKIEASEEKLNIVIDASELGTYELNLLTDEVIYSDKYLEIFGFGKGIALTHKELINRLHPAEMQMRNMAFKDALVSGTLFYQAKVVWNDKTIHWIEVKGKVFYNEEKKPVKLIGTVADITEEKVQKQALQESEERFRTIADNISQLAWMTNEKGQMIWFNKRWFEYSGTTMEQMLKDGAKNIHHPEHRSRVMDKYLKAIEEGKEWEDTFPLLGADGQYRWFLSRAITIKNADGKVKQWFGTNTDITQRMEAEETLKESEEKFRLLADSMPQHIWTSDPEGNLNYYNQSVFDYSGLTLEQINKDGWIQIVHPDDREENIKQWINSVSTGKDFLFEHRFRRHDGEYRWQLSRAVPQRDANGKIQMWVGTSTDIQEQKAFTQELEKLVGERTKELGDTNIELSKMNKELQSFAYISSHDLQEPLRKIQTFATRIKEKEENNLSDYGKDMFNRMQDAAKRMQTLIQDLLAYSHTNTTEHKFITTNLNEIIAEVKEDLKEELEGKQAIIEVNRLCDANIIPFQFRQLMHNLIGNSLKFSTPNHPPLIKIKSEIVDGIKLNNEKLKPQNKYCHITVSDNGIGFEQQYSEKIFEVFQRLHGKNEYNGTGIGLSIVKKIVENHNGIVVANGELNKGATFNIYIPQ